MFQKSRTMKISHILLLSTLMIPALAQDDAETHRYWVPFPERTYSGAFGVTLQFTAVESERAEILVQPLDAWGESVAPLETFYTEKGEVAAWHLPAQKQQTVQSLLLESDQTLYGMVILNHVDQGQINAVPLTCEASAQLIMPHIARNYFKWKTSFAVTGISDEFLASDIFFGYRNDRDSRYGEDWVSTLDRAGYLRRTAYLDVLMGDLSEDSVATWGMVRSADDLFLLTGYQTFARVEENRQTCATEIRHSLSQEGVLAFPAESDQQHAIVFCNPNDFNVTVKLMLIREEETGPQQRTPFVDDQSLVLAPQSNRILSLGTDLFPDLVGSPLALQFLATQDKNDEQSEELRGELEPEPAGIQALHFQNGSDETSMGAHHLDRVGSRVRAWADMDDDFDSAFILTNMDEEKRTIDVFLRPSQGDPLVKKIVLEPWSRVVLDEAWLLQALEWTPEEVTGQRVSVLVRPSVAIAPAGEEAQLHLAATWVLRSETDLALVNPYITQD